MPNNQYIQGSYPVIRKENLAKDTYDLTFLCPEMAEKAEAGQFVHVKAAGFFLRRPISICGIDRERGNLRIVFEVRGEGTKALARLNEGGLIDVLGPLGSGFTLLGKDKKAIVVGGGIGVPPMLETAKSYGENATALIGFRSAGAVILSDDFRKNGNDVILCTDDGTAGQNGFVTDALQRRLEVGDTDIIYACGPAVMLRKAVGLANRYKVRCEVSLEERMGCGVGACLVCACKTVKDGKTYFAHVCKDGPVFPAENVIWE